MSKQEWQLLLTVKSYEEAIVLVKSQFNVCRYRRSDLKNRTKYSFKCNEYRKYPLYSYEIQIIVPDYDPSSVTIMSRNTHEHHQKERHDYLHPYDKQYLNTFIVVYLSLKLNYH